MKLARLLCTAFSVTLIAGWATASTACDKDKASAAAANGSGTCTAAMAAQCTPEMAAACKAKMSAAAAGGCPAMQASAVVASASGTCAMHGAKATAASASTCAMHGVKASAAAAGGKDACCAGKASVTAASANGACANKNAAVAGECSGHGMGVMAAATTHDDCEACTDMSNCSEALDALGAHRQTVRLKNGVMYIYTADTPRNVSAVQAAVARRGEQMARIASTGEGAHLCTECKAIRGAMASGKLSREIVNITGGSLTLITSSDPKLVAKLHEMSMGDTKVAARIKS